MRICVQGCEEPRSFRLGGRSLAILAVTARWIDTRYCYYRVSVFDGREFVLRCDARRGIWELDAVFPAAPAPTAGQPWRELLIRLRLMQDRRREKARVCGRSWYFPRPSI
jgi:hypothetical protein